MKRKSDGKKNDGTNDGQKDKKTGRQKQRNKKRKETRRKGWRLGDPAPSFFTSMQDCVFFCWKMTALEGRKKETRRKARGARPFF